jgi:hypothetical protein
VSLEGLIAIVFYFCAFLVALSRLSALFFAPSNFFLTLNKSHYENLTQKGTCKPNIPHYIFFSVVDFFGGATPSPKERKLGNPRDYKWLEQIREIRSFRCTRKRANSLSPVWGN